MSSRVVRALAKGLLVGIALFAVALLALSLGSRFADGPIAVFPGGPLATGTATDFSEVDWEAVDIARELELQTLTPPVSRTVRFTVHEGRAYIHCSFCSNRILKRWPRQLEQDARILVRLGAQVIEARATRVEDASEEFAAVRDAAHRKFLGTDARSAAEDAASSAVVSAAELVPGHVPGEPTRWFFRVDPRQDSSR